jgi:hypothetical protein
MSVFTYFLSTVSQQMANWHYYNEQGEKITVTGGQLKELAKAGVITRDTIIETEDGRSGPARRMQGLTFGAAVPPEAPKPLPSVPVPSVKANAKDDGGDTPLHCAVLSGHLECAKILISNGADANTKSIYDVSPLDYTTKDTAMYECLSGKTRKEILEEQLLEQQLANLQQQAGNEGSREDRGLNFWLLPIIAGLLVVGWLYQKDRREQLDEEDKRRQQIQRLQDRGQEWIDRNYPYYR